MEPTWAPNGAHVGPQWPTWAINRKMDAGILARMLKSEPGWRNPSPDAQIPARMPRTPKWSPVGLPEGPNGCPGMLKMMIWDAFKKGFEAGRACFSVFVEESRWRCRNPRPDAQILARMPES